MAFTVTAAIQFQIDGSMTLEVFDFFHASGDFPEAWVYRRRASPVEIWPAIRLPRASPWKTRGAASVPACCGSTSRTWVPTTVREKPECLRIGLDPVESRGIERRSPWIINERQPRR